LQQGHLLVKIDEGSCTLDIYFTTNELLQRLTVEVVERQMTCLFTLCDG